MLKLKSYSDSGHGWLAVKRRDIFAIRHLITAFSYQRGMTVYLEEDCDCSLFLDYCKTNNIAYEIKHSPKWASVSPIRSYARYSPTITDSVQIVKVGF